MFGWLIGLKTKAIAFAVFLVALASALLWQKHAGKVEGEQIAAGKAANEVERAGRVAQVEQAKARQLPPNAAQTQLQKDWSR